MEFPAEKSPSAISPRPVSRFMLHTPGGDTATLGMLHWGCGDTVPRRWVFLKGKGGGYNQGWIYLGEWVRPPIGHKKGHDI